MRDVRMELETPRSHFRFQTPSIPAARSGDASLTFVKVSSRPETRQW
jgi:hypothetical protein